MIDIHKLEKEISEGLAKMESDLIKQELKKYLLREPTEEDFKRCQKRYHTKGDAINYSHYRLYYDFSYVGTVEHIFPDPFTTATTQTIKINFTPVNP